MPVRCLAALPRGDAEKNESAREIGLQWRGMDGWRICDFTSFQQYFSHIRTMGG